MGIANVVDPIVAAVIGVLLAVVAVAVVCVFAVGLRRMRLRRRARLAGDSLGSPDA